MKYKTVWKLVVLTGLLLSAFAAVAAETSPQHNAGGEVLGQEQSAANAATQDQASSGAQGQTAAGNGEEAQEAAASGEASPKDAAARREQVQKLFEESLRQMMPLGAVSLASETAPVAAQAVTRAESKRKNRVFSAKRRRVWFACPKSKLKMLL